MDRPRVDHVEGLSGDVLDDEDGDGHRRYDNADHEGDGDHDAEPYGIEAQFDDGRDKKSGWPGS